MTAQHPLFNKCFLHDPSLPEPHSLSTLWSHEVFLRLRLQAVVKVYSSKPLVTGLTIWATSHVVANAVKAVPGVGAIIGGADSGKNVRRG